MRQLHQICTVLAAAGGIALGGVAQAALLINEINLNSENDAPSGSDSGTEYFEILSDLGVESLDDLTFLVIEGDGGARGTIDQALTLGGFATGANGLFLWRDDAAVLSPAPDPATTVKVEDFSPDLENGSGTFVIVRDFSGAIGDDLDADDDGTIDSPGSLPWSAALDAVGVLDSSASDSSYAGQLVAGATDIVSVPFGADTLVRLANSGDWIAVDIDEDNSAYPGPYPFDDTQAQYADGTPLTPSVDLNFALRTPGSMNPSRIPEPQTLALGLAAALIGLAIRRK